MPPMNTLEQQLAAANSRPAPKVEPPQGKPPKQRATGKGKRTAAPAEIGRENKTHIGAWLHKDFKSSLLMVRAKTGEDAQDILARILNAEFRKQGVPVVEL
jgi:hypothetical protein